MAAQPSPALAASGARSYGQSDSARPIAVRQAITRSPGLSLVASFGPTSAGVADGSFVDHGLDIPVPALEVLRVDRSVDVVSTYDLDSVSTVVGGPESLLDLAAVGQLTTAPTILAGDLQSASPPGPVVTTDGLRRREVAFGELHPYKVPELLAMPVHAGLDKYLSWINSETSLAIS